MHAKLLQSFPTLYDPTDYSSQGSSAHGIHQARILEWVAMPSSRGSSWPRDQTWVSRITSRFLPSEPPENEYHNIFYEKLDHKYCFRGIPLFFPIIKLIVSCYRKGHFKSDISARNLSIFKKNFWKKYKILDICMRV